ncbi:hypothetical protein HK104_008723 [Borealophlyctis nickersoniae]|nr:hypothetical protein HK104_008723 [Borealophlyctis nickersoniae]
MAGKRVLLTLFTKRYCGLCEEAKEAVDRVRTKVAFDVTEVDIEQPQHKQWFRKYMFDVPVIHVNEEFAMQHRIDERLLEKIVRGQQQSNNNGSSNSGSGSDLGESFGEPTTKR